MHNSGKNAHFPKERTMATIKTSFGEKVGYGFGDMASSMFWKIFSYYLPFFYSNIFGLRLDQVALLLVVTRIWDAVSDPMMGILADRTNSKWGKYRPYLLMMAVPFALSGIFLFTTPDAGPTFKLIWAYITYIMMMTVYTGINVPYGAMLGVMTDDSDTKTVLSSFRMFFAYGGSFLALFLWEPLCNALGGYAEPAGWMNAMIVVAAIALVLFLLCFRMTKEKLHTVSTVSVGSDLKSLLKNAPWWILIGAALCSNLFNTVRGSTVAYFFNDVIGAEVHLNLGGLSFLFYAGLFLSIGEICNMVGVALAVPLAAAMGKKTTYMASFASLIALSIVFFYIPVTQGGYWWMIVLQILISIVTGVISPLVWSMYADVSDFAENKDGTASTALIFSSASMAQKFGGAFGGAAVMWLLQAFGYNTTAGAVQTPDAIYGLKLLMSWVPAAVAALAVVVVFFYPLTRRRMDRIQEELAVKRGPIVEDGASAVTSDQKKGFPLAMKVAAAVLAAILVFELGSVLIKGTAKSADVADQPTVARLYVEGTKLMAEGSDVPVVQHGVSLAWHNFWPSAIAEKSFYRANVVNQLVQDWGVDVVRAAIGADDLHGQPMMEGALPGYINEKEYTLERLYEVIDACVANGVYVIVDWHSHVLHLEEATDFFTEVATKYADCPNVIYELYNEPVEDSWADLKAYGESLIETITSISTVEPVILMGCPHWDQDINLPAEDPITTYKNIMYTVHFYAATHKQYLIDRTDAAVKAGLPVYISECGICEATGDGVMDVESWENWNNWADANDVSIVTWSMSEKDETCSMMVPGTDPMATWTDDQIKPWGKIVKDWLKK